MSRVCFDLFLGFCTVGEILMWTDSATNVCRNLNELPNVNVSESPSFSNRKLKRMRGQPRGKEWNTNNFRWWILSMKDSNKFSRVWIYDFKFCENILHVIHSDVAMVYWLMHVIF